MKTKLLIPFQFFLTLLAFNLSGQTTPSLEWVNGHGNTGVDIGKSIDVRPSSNGYNNGYYSGTVDISRSIEFI